MTWFSDFAEWFTSRDAQPWIFGAIVLFVAMLVSALVAARLARGTAHKLIAQRDFELRAGAISTLVDAAHDSSHWSQLSAHEQSAVNRAVAKAETVVRMLPIRGAEIAANWAAYQLAEIKRAAETATAQQLQPMVTDFRDRLLEWQKSPGRARRGFSNDLARWSAPAAAAAVTESAILGEGFVPAAGPEVTEPTPAWSPDAESTNSWGEDASWVEPTSTAPVDIPDNGSNNVEAAVTDAAEAASESEDAAKA